MFSSQARRIGVLLGAVLLSAACGTETGDAAGSTPGLPDDDGQAQAASAEPTLYERLGELPAIALVVSDFVDVFVADPLIMSNPEVRARKTPDAAPYIKFQVTSLLCEATGGPCAYQGRSLQEAHDGLNVSAEEWDRMVVLFSDVLAEHQVPERETEELFEILGPTREDIVVPDGP